MGEGAKSTWVPPDFAYMLKFGVPKIALRILYVMLMQGSFENPQYLCLLEFFAGKMAITKAFQRALLPALPYELKLDPLMDINSCAGTRDNLGP